MTATSPAPAPRLRSVHRQMRWAGPRTVVALILREMASTYGRNPGGYVWAILEPVGGIALLALVFSFGLRAPPIGTSFIMFFATGLLPFMLFTGVSLKVAQSLIYSRQLLVYPRVTFLDALLARFLLNTLTILVSSILILAACKIYIQTGTTLILDRALAGFGMAAALALGIGTLNCFLMSRFRVWRNVWSIATRPLVLISGVILPTASLPEPFRSWMLWNPLVHVVGETRSAFYLNYGASYVSPTYVLGIAAVCGVAGLLFLWRYHRDIIED
jgi:capsular polysaccharide transport system permease protein